MYIYMYIHLFISYICICSYFYNIYIYIYMFLHNVFICIERLLYGNISIMLYIIWILLLFIYYLVSCFCRG